MSKRKQTSPPRRMNIREKVVTVPQYSQSSLFSELKQAIAKAEEVASRHSDGSVDVDIDAYDDYGGSQSIDIVFYVCRQETDEEYEARQKALQEASDLAAAERYQRYLQLKEEFDKLI